MTTLSTLGLPSTSTLATVSPRVADTFATAWRAAIQSSRDAVNQCAVETAIQWLYAYQTADEQAAETTSHRNGVGFTAADAHRLSFIAAEVLAEGRHLRFATARSYTARLLRYAGQLGRISAAMEPSRRPSFLAGAPIAPSAPVAPPRPVTPAPVTGNDVAAILHTVAPAARSTSAAPMVDALSPSPESPAVALSPDDDGAGLSPAMLATLRALRCSCGCMGRRARR